MQTINQLMRLKSKHVRGVSRSLTPPAVTSAMNQLAPSDKNEFIRVANLAADERAESDPEKADFFRQVPENLGMV